MEMSPGAPSRPLQRAQYKTKLCKFHSLGRCLRGEACTWAHGEGELLAAAEAAPELDHSQAGAPAQSSQGRRQRPGPNGQAAVTAAASASAPWAKAGCLGAETLMFYACALATETQAFRMKVREEEAASLGGDEDFEEVATDSRPGDSEAETSLPDPEDVAEDFEEEEGDLVWSRSSTDAAVECREATTSDSAGESGWLSPEDEHFTFYLQGGDNSAE